MPIEDCHEIAIRFIELLVAHEVFYREVSLVLLLQHSIIDAVAKVGWLAGLLLLFCYITPLVQLVHHIHMQA